MRSSPFTPGAAPLWPRALDASDSYSNQVDAFVSPRSHNYGPAAFDRRQVFNANFYWIMPKPGKNTSFRPDRLVLDGWELAGVIRNNTGGTYAPSLYCLNGVTTTGAADGKLRKRCQEGTTAVSTRSENYLRSQLDAPVSTRGTRIADS